MRWSADHRRAHGRPSGGDSRMRHRVDEASGPSGHARRGGRVIALVDLGAQYRSIKPAIDTAVLDVLESGHFVAGRRVAAFEEGFARYCGSAAAVAVNSGTSALHLALLAYGIGQGDEVITVSMTFAATVAAILYTGAKPVLVDVDEKTWTIDPAAVER